MNLTVILREAADTWFMDRRSNEAEYVLKAWYRMREEVMAHPKLFERDALQRIEKAIAVLEPTTQPKAA